MERLNVFDLYRDMNVEMNHKTALVLKSKLIILNLVLPDKPLFLMYQACEPMKPINHIDRILNFRCVSCMLCAVFVVVWIFKSLHNSARIARQTNIKKVFFARKGKNTQVFYPCVKTEKK